MIISAAVIGLNEKALDFISRFKAKTYYKKTDEDLIAARIHCIHVNDLNLVKYSELKHSLIDEETGNNTLSFKDGDEENGRRIPLGDQAEWFAETNGHRTVLEFVDEEDPSKYLKVLKTQIKPEGYDIHITSESLLPYREELETLAKEVNATIYFYSGDSAVDEILAYLDKKFERETAASGEACGITLDEGIDWS